MNAFVRRADFRPDTFNAERRTVEVVFSTSNPVQRNGFEEVLSHEAGAVDLSRLVGASVLNNHDYRDIAKVVGVVRSAKIENGQGIATIELDADPDLLRKVETGILRFVSVGYTVRPGDWREVKKNGSTRRRTATRWQPFELSLVNAAADHNAITRNNPMPEITPDPPITRAAIRGQIRSIAQSAGLTPDWADAQIDAEADLTAVRAAAFEAMQARSQPRIRVAPGISHDGPALVRSQRAEAIAARMLGTVPSEPARRFMAERVVDHARAVLELAGISTRGLGDQQVFERAWAPMTTSDFPQLMGTATNRVLLEAYSVAASLLKALGRQALHPDFKGRTLVRVGELSALSKVSEAGEIKSQARGESGTLYFLQTYAGIISYSRKLMINDDLNDLSDQSVAQGQAAAQTEANVLYSLFVEAGGQGPLMYDGIRLFNAAHGNVATGAGLLSVDNLSLARQAMRAQTGLDGTTRINVVPKYLVVGPVLETTADQLLTTLAAAAVEDVNPFASKLSLLVEPRIQDDSWYLFATNPVSLEYAYLSSAPGPQLTVFEPFDTLGMSFRVVLDFGAGFVDWRAAYRNPGV